MPRYFAPITQEELAEKIIETTKGYTDIGEDYDHDDTLCASTYDLRYCCQHVNQDLSKVIFDHENFEMDPYGDDWPAEGFVGFHTLDNGLTYLGAVAGGDWEVPVYYIIYWDGKNLRAYIPTDGNTWNKETKTAFGSEGDRDYEKYKDYWDREPEPVVPDPDVELMLEDIKARVLPKESKYNIRKRR